MSSRVPTVDNFILISTDTLRTWSIEEIQAYSTVLSKVIAKETEAINYNQKVIAKNESELVKIDTELKTIDKQVIANQNAIISYNMRYGDSLLFNKNIDSTIASNIKSISDTEDKIMTYDTLITDLDNKLADIEVNGDPTFDEAAAHYSTIVIEYLVAEKLLENSLYSTTLLSTLYESSIFSISDSLVYLQDCANDVLSTTIELSTLYTERVGINSTLTQQRIEEVIYTYAYASTSAGLLQLSTLYDTSLMFSTYNGLVSTHNTTVAQYNMALNNYTLASQNPTTTLYGATAAGWATLMNSLSAKDTEIQSQILLTSNSINTQIVNSEMIFVKASEVAVEIGQQTISSLTDYENIAESNIKYYSTMFDDATLVIQSSMNAYMLYNTYYVSTVTASNANMDNIMKTISTYGNDKTGIDEITARVQVIHDQYTELTSTYMGNITFSTLMHSEKMEATIEFNNYSTLYESTNTALIRLNDDLIKNESTIYGTVGELNTASTLMDMENLNMLICNTGISMATTNMNVNMYGYREAYVLTKRMNAQNYYDSTILLQVNRTNDINQAEASDSVSAVDINTSEITLAYTNLNLIQQFLDTFDSIYSAYDNYMTGLLNLSTSLGNEKENYSTLASYRTLSYIYPDDTSYRSRINGASSNYESSHLDSLQKVQDLVPSNAAVDIINSDFLSRYTKVFSQEDIIEIESTILFYADDGYNSFTGDVSSVTVSGDRKYFADTQIKLPALDFMTPVQEVVKSKEAAMPAEVIRQNREVLVARTPEQEAARDAGMPTP